MLEAFRAAKGGIAPVHAIDQVFADPKMQAQDAITSVPDEHFGTVRMQNVVPRFVGEPGVVRHSGGSIGQDNDEVYGGLGIDAAERARLRECGAI